MVTITLRLGGEDVGMNLAEVSEMIQLYFESCEEQGKQPRIQLGNLYVLEIDPSSWQVSTR